MNQVILIGRLTRDPEHKSIGDKDLSTFTLAVDDPYGGEALFIDINVWGKQATNVQKYVTKGQQVAIGGRLKIDSYEKDGQKRKATKVVANSVQFLGKKQGDNASQQSDNVSEGDVPF